MFDLTRRRLLQGTLALVAMPSPVSWADSDSILHKPIPKTSESLPAIGMGTWITFNVGNVASLRRQRTEVVSVFQQMGGRVIDSSPMYGSSEEVVGHCLDTIDGHSKLFSATKTWTGSTQQGMSQFLDSLKLWRTPRLDLLQIHNLLNWRGHLNTLKQLKQEGKVRYIGVTTSHGRRHADIERIMLNEDIDFVQFTYNVLDRAAEQRLLPVAKERGIAVIINRPYQGGRLPDLARERRVPPWAAEIDCVSWPQLLLKFIISHPAVTCAIPATSRVEHMRENMLAMQGRMPDERQRNLILNAFRQL